MSKCTNTCPSSCKKKHTHTQHNPDFCTHTPHPLLGRWSGPYLKRIISAVKSTHPLTPLTVYANGSGGLLERLKATGADVVGLDWTVDMADARRRLGNDVSLQGNVDPTILFASDVSLLSASERQELSKEHVLNVCREVCGIGQGCVWQR